MSCISQKFSVVAKASNSLSIYLALVLIVLLNNLQCSASALSTTIPPPTSSNFSSHEPSCSNVKDIFTQRGIADKDLPAKFPIKDVKLRYCDVSLAGSCCNIAMEQKMALYSRQAMEKNTRDVISKMSSTLQTRAQKFNELFKALLAQSRDGFHQMFKQTYGVIYEQNSYVFSELFVKLEGYFLRGKLDLTDMMDKFFNQLYQKMFTVINSHYHFNDEYLNCVSEYMKELKPFGDVPDKLSVQVKRSFVATRTFVQALSAAAEVAKNMMPMKPLQECTAALTKMSTCGSCMGFSEKPCEQYCVNVMKTCLQQYVELDTEWDLFVAQMEKVSDRLLGPFNIVMVVEPINIKISEAIMNFQESGQDISKRVFVGCGQPKLGRQRRSSLPLFNSNADLFIDDEEDVASSEVSGERTKRAADPANQENRRNNQEIKVEPFKFPRNENFSGNRGNTNRGRSSNRSNTQRYTNGNKNSDNSRESSLDKLVKEIRQKVKDTKKFWSNLPYTACNNDEFAPAGNSDNCWNGQSINRYIPSTKPSDVASNTNIKQHNIVAQQIQSLKITTNHLKNAYNGNDIEWSDDESEGHYESGSGSGSGIDDEDDDDDSGSGLGSYPDEIQPAIIPPHNPIDPGTRHVNTHDVVRNNVDDDHHHSTDDSDISVHSHDSKSHSGSSSQSRDTWKAKRIILTYFVPIVMAWFGGSISGAVADLL